MGKRLGAPFPAEELWQLKATDMGRLIFFSPGKVVYAPVDGLYTCAHSDNTDLDPVDFEMRT